MEKTADHFSQKGKNIVASRTAHLIGYARTDLLRYQAVRKAVFGILDRLNKNWRHAS